MIMHTVRYIHVIIMQPIRYTRYLVNIERERSSMNINRRCSKKRKKKCWLVTWSFFSPVPSHSFFVLVLWMVSDVRLSDSGIGIVICYDLFRVSSPFCLS